jgi:hypothetical protein
MQLPPLLLRLLLGMANALLSNASADAANLRPQLQMQRAQRLPLQMLHCQTAGPQAEEE